MAIEKSVGSDQEFNEDGSLNPHYVDPAGNDGAAADTKNKGDEEEEDEGGNKGEDEGFNDTIDPNNPPEIPIRQSTAQNIIARKNRTIDKLRSKQPKEGDEGYVPPEDDGEDGDENLPLEASRAIDRTVQKHLAPLLGKLASDADNKEFEALIKAEPEAAKFANHIKAYMSHDAYKNVPPTFIYRALAFENAQRIGAKKRAAADLDAGQRKGGGRTIPAKSDVSGLPSAEDIAAMDDAEFDKMQEAVLQGRY